MTRAAKILILVNMALSVMFLAWSFGLFTQTPPWISYTAGEEKIVGRIDELKTQLAALADGRDKAEEKWFTATREVIRLTDDIRNRRKFYDAQYKIVETGTDFQGNEVKPAVQKLEYQGPAMVSLLTLKATGRPPVQIDGKDALSIAGYKKIIEQQLADIRKKKQDINKTIADTTALTLEIAGTNPGEQAITAAEKGLRGQLIDAQALIKNLILEQEYLQTPLTNYRVDLELHKRRQATLEARLRELSTTAMR